jgi:hypothetical protein
METNKPTKKPDVHARKLGNEWLLYDSELEKLHIVNPTAELVWRLCDGKHDLAAIKSEIRGAYDVGDARQLEGDLRRILDEFEQIGILKRS